MLRDFKSWNLIKKLQKNKTKWYRVGYFVPVDIRTDKHTISLFDFKKLYGKGEKTHDGAFNIVNNRFTWNFNSPNYSAYKNEMGAEYFYQNIMLLILILTFLLKVNGLMFY